MKVFISWSGNLSKALATEMRDWFPQVIQAIDPFVASEDISKGDRWQTRLNKELEGHAVGILCVTPNNVAAPWLNFEAGALSKLLEDSRVMPLAFGLKNTDIPQPLGQFQATEFNRSDMKRLVKSINAAMSTGKLAEGVLERSFETFWPDFERTVNDLLDTAPELVGDERPPVRTDRELLEELLELVRDQERSSRRDHRSVSANLLQYLRTEWLQLVSILVQSDVRRNTELRTILMELGETVQLILEEAGYRPTKPFELIERENHQRRIQSVPMHHDREPVEDDELDDVPF